MMQLVERSPNRLVADFIAGYWLHPCNQITPIEEVMRASGLDRHFGFEVRGRYR